MKWYFMGVDATSAKIPLLIVLEDRIELREVSKLRVYHTEAETRQALR